MEKPEERARTHTPGPWFVGDETYPIIWPTSDKGRTGRMICQPARAEDAALVASAPALAARVEELTEILRGVVDQLDGIGIPEWHGAEGLDLDAARAALAAAKGVR